MTGQRGGIHNSVTRTVLKPTHMIGGYAQLAYGFNYYGTDRHQPRRVRHRPQDGEGRLAGRARHADQPRTVRASLPKMEAARMKVRAQIAMVLNLDKCIGCHTCSVTCKNVWTSREGMEYAWFNNVETKPGIGYPKDWENQDRWKGGWERKRNGKIEPRIGAQVARAGEDLRQPRPAGDRRLLRALHLRLRAPADGAGDGGLRRRRGRAR